MLMVAIAEANCAMMVVNCKKVVTLFSFFSLVSGSTTSLPGKMVGLILNKPKCLVLLDLPLAYTT